MTSVGIVDDNLTALGQMRLLLGRTGFGDIRGFTDPRKALVAFRAKPPGLLLLDYQMPELDGVQLLGLLQQAGAVQHTPVVMVSGCADLAAIRMLAYLAVAHKVIAKPLIPQEFSLKIRNLMRLAAMASTAVHGFQPFNLLCTGSITSARC